MRDIYSLVLHDYFNAENKRINTIASRIKRNKRFDRNANRIFRRKANYMGYISGITVITQEMLTQFTAPNP